MLAGVGEWVSGVCVNEERRKKRDVVVVVGSSINIRSRIVVVVVVVVAAASVVVVGVQQQPNCHSVYFPVTTGTSPVSKETGELYHTASSNETRWKSP